MSMLAEVVVEEWLNRQGYFTIRGIKLGHDEIDLLAVRIFNDGTIERRHIEVQASVRPVGYISISKPNISSDELQAQVRKWVHKKFEKENKKELLASFGHGKWTSELVVYRVKSEDEVDLIRNCGIKVLRLTDIVRELGSLKGIIRSASGADLLELMHLNSSDNTPPSNVIETAL